jgi:hypothetical protein
MQNERAPHSLALVEMVASPNKPFSLARPLGVARMCLVQSACLDGSSASTTASEDGWRHFESTGHGIPPWLCEAVMMQMAAARYSADDVVRLSRVLGEAGARAEGAVPDAKGGYPILTLSYRVSETDVRVEIVGTHVDRLILANGSLIWMTLRELSGELDLETYRLVH